MKIKPLPSIVRLNEAFLYCPDTGELRCKIDRPARAKKGEIAGTLTKLGYVNVTIDGQHYMAHRIIWKIVTGEDPVGLIDHRDGDGANNRFQNLRIADHSKNICNSKVRSDNTSGVKGVSYDKRSRKWDAYIMRDQRAFRLGQFRTIEEAATVVRSARAELHREFARMD